MPSRRRSRRSSPRPVRTRRSRGTLRTRRRFADLTRRPRRESLWCANPSTRRWEMHTSKLRWGIAGGVAMLCAALVGVAGADVKPKQIHTQVRFLEVNRTTFREFTGQIKAGFPCKDDRLVNLTYKPDESATPQKLGTDETNKKGKFDID